MAETLSLFIDNDGQVFKVDPDTGRHTPLPPATASSLSGGPLPQSQGAGTANPPPLFDANTLQRGASLAGFGAIATAIARFSAVAGLVEDLRKRIEANIAAQKAVTDAQAREIAAQRQAQQNAVQRTAQAAQARIQNRINNAPITADVEVSADEDNAIRRGVRQNYNRRQERRDAKRKRSRSNLPSTARAATSRVSSTAKAATGRTSSVIANATAGGARAASTSGATAAEGAGALAGAEALAALAGPVGIVVGALAAAGTAVYAFKSAVESTVAGLKQYAPQTSMAVARSQVKSVMQDVAHAQALDSDMSQFVELQNEVVMMLKTIWRGIAKWGLEALMPLLQDLFKVVKALFDFTIDKIVSVGDKLSPLFKMALDAGTGIIDALIDIAKNIKALRDADPVGVDPMLDALFGMNVPNWLPNPKNQAGGTVTPGPVGGPKLIL